MSSGVHPLSPPSSTCKSEVAQPLQQLADLLDDVNYPSRRAGVSDSPPEGSLFDRLPYHIQVFLLHTCFKQLNQKQLHGSIALVCSQWHQLVSTSYSTSLSVHIPIFSTTSATSFSFWLQTPAATKHLQHLTITSSDRKCGFSTLGPESDTLFPALGAATQLRSLELSPSHSLEPHPTAEHVQHLSSLTNLTRLRWQSCSNSFSCLSPLSALSSLQILELPRNTTSYSRTFSDADSIVISGLLQTLPLLERLDLSGNNMCNLRDNTMFAEMADLPELQLNLGGCHLPASCYADDDVLEVLPSCTDLGVVLQLLYPDEMGEYDLYEDELEPPPQLQALEDLLLNEGGCLEGFSLTLWCQGDSQRSDVPFEEFEDEDQWRVDPSELPDSLLEAIIELTQLQRLEFRFVAFGCEDMLSLTELMGLSRLRLDGCDRLPSGLSALSSLRELVLYDVNTGGRLDSADILINSASASCLTHLELSHFWFLPDEKLLQLVNSFQKLQQLVLLSSSALTPAGYLHLTRLTGLTQLQVGSLGERGAKGVTASLVQITGLRSLSLTWRGTWRGLLRLLLLRR